MNNKIIASLIIGALILVALYVGLLVGTSDYITLSTYFVTASIIWFMITGWQYTWQITAFFCFTGVIVHQGFRIEASHMLFMMLAAASLIALLRQRNITVPILFKRAGHRHLLFFIFIFMLYGAVHGIYNYIHPYAPLDYAIDNAAKGYFAAFSGFAMVFWIVGGRFQFVLRPSWLTAFWLIAFLGILTNTIYILMLIGAGYGADSATDHFGKAWQHSFYIPVLNMRLGQYTLRTLSPLLLFLALLFILNKRCLMNMSIIARAAVLLTVPLCLTGAVVSGGRGAVILCILFTGLALIKQKRFVTIMTGTACAIICVILVNVFSKSINQNAPLFVSRPLQLIMVEKGYAYSTIKDSDISRNHAAEAGWQEWRSNSRVFWFGRSIYEHLGLEYYATLKRQVGEREAFAFYALRAGTLHNLYGDLVVQYGLIGAVLYTLCMLSCIIYSFNLYRQCKRLDMPPEASEIAFYVAAVLPVFFLVQIKGGGYMMAIIPLMIGILRAIAFQQQAIQKNKVADLDNCEPPALSKRL